MPFQKNSILKPQNGSEFHGGGGRAGGSLSPKTLKTYMKLNWNLVEVGGGGGGLEKIPSVGKVRIFSGNKQYPNKM